MSIPSTHFDSGKRGSKTMFANNGDIVRIRDNVIAALDQGLCFPEFEGVLISIGPAFVTILSGKHRVITSKSFVLKRL